MRQAPPVTRGRVVRSVSAAGFRVTESIHAPDTRLRDHAHDRAALTLILSGGMAESFGRTECRCEPLTLLLKPAGAVHRDRYCATPTRSLIVELEEPDAAKDVVLVAGGTAVVLALALYRAILVKEPGFALRADELVASIVELATAGSRDRDARTPPWLRRVRDLLESSAAPPRLADLAAEAGVHAVYLARAFRRRYGCSIGTFVRRARLNRAVDALVSGSEPISEVALRLGYSDQSHLTRDLRRRAAWSPARLRRALVRIVQDSRSARS